MRETMDGRLTRLTTPDPREEKLARWVQQELFGLRREIADAFEREAALRQEVPLEESDIWVEVGVDEERFVGLGKRARVVIPLGDERWPDGRPKRYVEVTAGRPHTIRRLNGEPEPVNPVTHASIRTSGRVMVLAEVSNVVSIVTDES